MVGRQKHIEVFSGYTVVIEQWTVLVTPHLSTFQCFMRPLRSQEFPEGKKYLGCRGWEKKVFFTHLLQALRSLPNRLKVVVSGVGLTLYWPIAWFGFVFVWFWLASISSWCTGQEKTTEQESAIFFITCSRPSGYFWDNYILCGNQEDKYQIHTKVHVHVWGDSMVLTICHNDHGIISQWYIIGMFQISPDHPTVNL